MSAVVVGGGVDGLVAALGLARGGHAVTLLERDGVLGGRFAARPVVDGFRSPLLHDTSSVPVAVTAGLDAHGLRRVAAPQVWSVSAGEPAFAIPPGWEGASGLTADDATVLGKLSRRLAAWTPAVGGALAEPVPGLLGAELDLWAVGKRALAVRRLGVTEMTELLRLAPGSVDDLLAEHITGARLRATLAWPALFGAWMGPLSPQSATNLILWRATAGDEIDGGGPALVAALERACREAGVVLQTGRSVTRVLVDGGVRGVEADGEELEGDRVVLAIPAGRVRDLLGPFALPPVVEDDLRTFRSRGIVAKVDLAVEGWPAWVGVDGARPRHVRTARSPHELERAFDAVKYRRMAERPCLDVRVLDEGFAPDGGCVLSIHAHGVPHDLDGGWTDTARAELSRRVRAVLDEVAPGLRVVGESVRSPADLAERHALPGGHLAHGELALDQLWANRPSIALSRHRTPIPGLLLGSASTHPGLPGASGRMAADAALRR